MVLLPPAGLSLHFRMLPRHTPPGRVGGGMGSGGLREGPHLLTHKCSPSEQPVAEASAETLLIWELSSKKPLSFWKEISSGRFLCSLEIDLKCMLRKGLPHYREGKFVSDVRAEEGSKASTHSDFIRATKAWLGAGVEERAPGVMGARSTGRSGGGKG